MAILLVKRYMGRLISEIAKEYKRLCDEERACIAELANLPFGSIQKKMIKGKEYFYLQYRDGKRVKSDYIKREDLEVVKERLRCRKDMEAELLDIKTKKDALEVVFDRDNLMIAIIQMAVLKVVKDFPEIKKVVLFGSRAEGRYRDDSDVDLMFESRRPVSLMRQSEFRIRLEEEIGLEVDLIHGPLKSDSFLEVPTEVEVYAA